MSTSTPAPAIAALRALLSTPRRIAIVTHHNPDGDAIGSSLGFMHVLKSAGHTVQVLLPNAPPSFLHWMPGYAGTIAHDTDTAKATEAIQQCEALFCLDFNRLDRVERMQELLKTAPMKVLIDHHREPDDFDISFSDTAACATSQMVFDIVEAMGWSQLISADAATCLYTGIMMDSGSFRYSSTTPHTHRVAAALMERGAVPDTIHSAVLDDNTHDRLRLLGFALSERLVVHPELGTATITLSMADQKRFNFRPGDTEGLVNHGLSIRGIRLAAFFMERSDRVKVSLRSKGQLPADRICADHFLGGGHRNAAGGHAFEPMQQMVDRFLAVIPPYLKL